MNNTCAQCDDDGEEKQVYYDDLDATAININILKRPSIARVLLSV